MTARVSASRGSEAIGAACVSRSRVPAPQYRQRSTLETCWRLLRDAGELPVAFPGAHQRAAKFEADAIAERATGPAVTHLGPSHQLLRLDVQKHPGTRLQRHARRDQCAQGVQVNSADLEFLAVDFQP